MSYYDYECPKGHKEELKAKIGYAPDKVDCQKCDQMMSRSFKNQNISGKVQGGTSGGSKMVRAQS